MWMELFWQPGALAAWGAVNKVRAVLAGRTLLEHAVANLALR